MISGVAGFLGSHVAQHCLGNGMEVCGVDDLSGGKYENVPGEVSFFPGNGDITDPKNVRRVWERYGPFDAVYHLAAYAAEGLSHFIRGYNYTNNLIGTTNIINECIRQADITGKMPHLVFTSSIAVYGHPEALPVTEEMTPQPIDPYGIAKYACELDIQAAAEMWGLGYTIFRPFNVYGERQNLSDPYRNVVGIFMRQALTGKPFTVFGDGEQQRAFSYVDDVAPYIAAAPGIERAHNQTFNVGGEVPFTVYQLANEIAAYFDIPCNVERLAPRNEVQCVYADPGKLHRAFGRKYPTSLRDGIAKMGEWAKTQEIANPKPFTNIEIDWKLPPSWRNLK